MVVYVDNMKVYENRIEKGKKMILLQRTNIKTGKSYYDLVKDNGLGIPGNVNGNIRKYHGWRGTTNNIELYALGLHEVLNIIEYKNGNCKITLSEDLATDRE